MGGKAYVKLFKLNIRLKPKSDGNINLSILLMKKSFKTRVHMI